MAEKAGKTLDSLKEKTYKKVFLKSVKKDTLVPEEAPIIEIELIKKGKITKNKRFFKFYNDKCIFFQVKSLFFFETYFYRIKSMLKK